MDEAHPPDLNAFDKRLAEMHLRGQWTADALMHKAQDGPPKIGVTYVRRHHDVTPEGDRIFVPWVCTRFDSVEDDEEGRRPKSYHVGKIEIAIEEGGFDEDHQACVWAVHRVSAPI